MADDANNEPAAQVAAQEAQIEAAKPSKAAAPADVADDAPDDGAGETPPRVWLVYNPDSGRRYNHIPTRGSGANGELTPDEVVAYFQTRALYKDATSRGADGKQAPMYIRARKADLRPNVPYEGDLKEAAGHGES